jgi:hypothetical protein
MPEKLGKGWIVSLSTSTRTCARMASVASPTRIPCGPGSTPAYSVSLMALAVDLVTHETQYFADPFQAAASRTALAEPIADHDR